MGLWVVDCGGDFSMWIELKDGNPEMGEDCMVFSSVVASWEKEGDLVFLGLFLVWKIYVVVKKRNGEMKMGERS